MQANHAVAPAPAVGDPASLSDLAAQLRWLRAYALVTYPFACVPFLFLWFRHHGIDEAGYGEIVGVYYVAMFVAEVPTGVLADRFGRKRMLVLGPLLLALGFLTLLVWPTYAGFLAGEALLGIGHAVLSGPPAAYLYETLAAHGQQHRFLREEAKLGALRMLGTGSAFLLGGLLAQPGVAAGDDAAYGATIVATCVGTTLAALLAMALRPTDARVPLRARVFAQHVGAELRKPAVAWLLVYWVVLFALLRFPFHDYQPYLRAAGHQEPLLHDPWLVGLLFAAMNLLASPLSALVPRLCERHGRVPLFWAMPLLLSGSLLVMAAERAAADAGHGTRALVWLGVLMFFVQQVPFGMHQALLQEFVNHRIGAATRTTVLSVLSLGARAVYALLNVLLFHLQGAHGLPAALATAGGCGLVAAVLVLRLRPRGVLRGAGPVA